MKHKGDKMELAEDRIVELLKCHDRYIKDCKYIRMNELYRTIVEWPCRRFWVSSTRAALVVVAIMNGDKLSNMLPLKREMYMEIYNRVKELSRDYPERDIHSLCEMAVCQPAPKFYLTPGSAKIMISKAKKEWGKKKMEKLWNNRRKEA